MLVMHLCLERLLNYASIIFSTLGCVVTYENKEFSQEISINVSFCGTVYIKCKLLESVNGCYVSCVYQKASCFLRKNKSRFLLIQVFIFYINHTG